MSHKSASSKKLSSEGKQKEVQSISRSKEKRKLQPVRPRRAITLLVAMVTVVCCMGAIASWRGNQNSPEFSKKLLTAGVPLAMPATNPSKEYVYSGSALLATSEPAGNIPTPTRVNYALASNGSTATASSADGNYPVSTIINGDRPGTNSSLWISGAGLPQWAEVNFGQARTIDEINVITVQDNYQNPVEPTLATTFTSTHANTAFEVQYWDGAAWVSITSVAGNNKVWRQFTFPSITTTRIRINVTATGDNYAYLTEVEAFGNIPATPTPTPTATPTPTPTVRTNYALASNGSTATASSADPSNPVSTIINGDRPGTNLSLWVSGAGLPQWAEVNFGQARAIDEINVITIQNDYQHPSEPTLTTTFTSTYGNTAFDVQYWNGSAWVSITSVAGNNNVWRQFTFPSVTTTKIRINVTGSADSYAYLTEVEALGSN